MDNDIDFYNTFQRIPYIRPTKIFNYKKYKAGITGCTEPANIVASINNNSLPSSSGSYLAQNYEIPSIPCDVFNSGKFEEEITPSTTSTFPSVNNVNVSVSSTSVEIVQKTGQSQTILISEDDFMDDDEFELNFRLSNTGNTSTTCNVRNTSSPIGCTSKKTTPDESMVIDLDGIDWNEDFLNESTTTANKNTSNVPKFTNRQDDCAEFSGLYAHSEIMLEVLNQKFGLRKFRPHQREIINASLSQHDCFVLMPTGGGKSLCYQLPAILTPGVTVVISPLRALISDQVDKLNALDVPAGNLTADVKLTDSDAIFSKLYMHEPQIKLLYLTPEKLSASGKVGNMLNRLYERDKVSRFVIDEVHCMSQWGHDFRPDYKQLSCLRQRWPKVPIICLTATATKQVQNDVLNTLDIRNVKTFIRSFNRPNIKYSVVPKTSRTNSVNDIAELIQKKFTKKSGIIYCLSRADCERLAQDLCGVNVKARPYHAGMSDALRERQQRDWMQDKFHVIVATIAFGMGIDKADVRFVIHNSIPKSVAAFYQESGRAGRDGEISYSYLFYSYHDVVRLRSLTLSDPKLKATSIMGHKENLDQMVAYCENTVDCRRFLQLSHLGETFDRKICISNKATICDNCQQADTHQLLDVSVEAKQLAQLVSDLSRHGNVTLLHVLDVYRGSKIKKILEKQHDKHHLYGKGAHLHRNDVHRILVQLTLKHVLKDYSTYTGDFPVVYLKVDTNFHYFLTSNVKLTITTATTSSSNNRSTGSSSGTPTSTKLSTSAQSSKKPTIRTTSSTVTKRQMDEIKVTCHEELLEECRRLAIDKQVTLSSIMNLTALKTMSDLLPVTEEEMLNIQHVTKANYAKYGNSFLEITKRCRQKLDILLSTIIDSPNAKQSTQGSTTNNSFSEILMEDDWQPLTMSASTSKRGRKRSSSNTSYRRGGGANRFKRWRKNSGGGGGTTKKSSATKKTPKSRKTGNFSSSRGPKVDFMPLI